MRHLHNMPSPSSYQKIINFIPQTNTKFRQANYKLETIQFMNFYDYDRYFNDCPRILFKSNLNQITL